MAPKRVTISLNDAERFFWDHAGYSHDPATEDARSGRARGAVTLARAERTLQKMSDVSVIWEDETTPWEDLSDPAVDPERPNYWLCAVIVRDQGDPDNPDILGSLGGIGLSDMNDPYRRVVEAELADEYL